MPSMLCNFTHQNFMVWTACLSTFSAKELSDLTVLIYDIIARNFVSQLRPIAGQWSRWGTFL